MYYLVLSWLYSPSLIVGHLFNFLICAQLIGHFGWGIRPTQSIYLHTEQHKHRPPCHNWDWNPQPKSLSGRRIHALDCVATVVGLKEIILLVCKQNNKQNKLSGLWSASELFISSGRRWSVKLVPSFADRGVSRGQHGESRTVVKLGFLDRSRYVSFNKLFNYPQEAEWTRFRAKCFSEKS
jgi:hypothetical protein